MMLCGEQYSVQSAAVSSHLSEFFVTSESHQATAPRLLSLMQLACIAPKLCPSSCVRTSAAESTVELLRMFISDFVPPTDAIPAKRAPLQ